MPIDDHAQSVVMPNLFIAAYDARHGNGARLFPFSFHGLRAGALAEAPSFAGIIGPLLAPFMPCAAG